MSDRWATFDCYGTLIDWNGGLTDALFRVWPDGNLARLLRHYHVVEPLVQEDRSLPYREVQARCLRAAGWKLAILSNTDPNLLAESLKQIGVPADLAITAAEAGSYKPAPGHWQR